MPLIPVRRPPCDGAPCFKHSHRPELSNFAQSAGPLKAVDQSHPAAASLAPFSESFNLTEPLPFVNPLCRLSFQTSSGRPVRLTLSS